MKVAMIGTVASSFYGFRADLIKALIELNHEVFAFTSEYKEDDLSKIRALGATPIPYKLSRGGLNPLNDIKATLSLAKKIKSLQPDLVFSYFSKPVIFGTWAAKLANTPKIIGMIEGLGYTFTDQPEGTTYKTKIIKNIQIGLYKLALPKLDTLIFLNPDDPKDLLQKHAIKVNNVEVLGGIGLNLDTYLHHPIPNTQGSIKFLFIARLIKEKGIHDFIAAAKLVKLKYPDTKFTVLGSIDSSNLGGLTQIELDQLIASEIIDYPGYVTNVPEWIAQSHVFVLPSYYREGVPRSTQEAMAIGRPIITTDVPGCRETVIDGRNGFLIEKWNPDALAKKMIYFIENPEKVEEMGLESYKIAQEKYDANKVNKRLLKILGVKI